MSFLAGNCSLCELVSPADMEGFACGDKDLDDFFHDDCFNYAKQLLGKSFCYKLDEVPYDVVCAFTLSNASIRVDDLPNARRKKVESGIPHVKTLKDYPAVLVGRLAVSGSFRHKHVGSDALDFIKFWFVIQTIRRDVVLLPLTHTMTLAHWLFMLTMVSRWCSVPTSKKRNIVALRMMPF